MEKSKIIVYNTHQCHPIIWPSMISLQAGFEQQGYDTVLCDFDDSESLQAGYKLLVQPGKVLFTVGVNNLGMELPASDGQIFSVYRDIAVPHVSVMLDVPYNHCISGYDAECKNHIVTMLDRTIGTYLSYAYPEKKMHKLFLPLGGSSNKAIGEVFGNERPYGVVFCASWWGDTVVARNWHDGQIKREIVHILDDVADHLERYPVNTVQAFQFVLKDRGMLDEEYIQYLLPYFELIQRYIKPYRRLKALEFLMRNDIAVDVFGSGWEDVSFANKLTLHGPISYQESIEIFAKAKIIYQDQAEFNNGAHDRVFTAMLNGAVVVTEYSSYLDEEFIDGQDLYMFDWQHGNEQVQVIRDLLADEPRRLSVALNAYSKADKRHRWSNRAERILETVNIFYHGDNQSK